MSNKISIEEWCNRALLSKDNQYNILRHLTSSGYGEFFLAITSENYLVGLKIFMDKKYLENEIENLKLVQRKIEDTFLPYLDYFIVNIDSNLYYIMVMKYFEGWILLSDYLSKCLFHDEQRNNIKNKLEMIVHKLHGLSIVHHDIDIDKILIHSKNGNIRFMDLGFCMTRFSHDVREEEFEKMKQRDLDMLSELN
jgi:serine/threonine protein kinase